MPQLRRREEIQDGHVWSSLGLCAFLVVCTCSGATARRLQHSEQEPSFRDKRSNLNSLEQWSQWSQWYNYDRPWIGQGDFETTDRIQQQQSICPPDQQVDKAECRVSGSTDIFDVYTYNRSQTDVLLQACTVYGLICLNSQQPEGRTCQDYELRFLCTDARGGEPGSRHFLGFDLKIYIILAAAPLLVFALRILWSCVHRHQRKRQLPHRERSFSDSTMSSIDSNNEAVGSSLASPPPAYLDLFGHGPPQVFAISDGMLLGCSACQHCGVSSAIENLRVASGTEDERGVTSPGSRAAIPAAGAVEDQASDGRLRSANNAAQHLTSRDATSGNEITSSPSTGDVRAADLSEANARTPVGLPPDAAAAAASAERVRSENGLHSGHPSCACPRHTLRLVITSGRDNPAFMGDLGYDCEPKLGPGMHKPALPFIRVNSATSFLSATDSLPDYDQALEILNAEHTGGSARGEVANDVSISRANGCSNSS